MKLINELLTVTPQNIDESRRKYDKTSEDIKIDLQILKDWIFKQPHLPQNYDERRLERMLLRNKFRIEQCKRKIDSYFTLRGMYPQFFPNQGYTVKRFEPTRKTLIIVPMPHINDRNERIVCTKFLPECHNLFDARGYFEYVLAQMDLEFSHDYAVSTRVIMDMSNLTMAHVKTMDLNVVIKGFLLYQTAYCARISGIDYINAPKYTELVMKILKLAMKPKMYAKIKTHKDLNSLHREVNKKYLPSDFGGEQKSMEELHEMMGEMWKEEIDFIAANAKLVSNEKLRIGEPYRNDSFGLDGTFKQINLD